MMIEVILIEYLTSALSLTDRVSAELPEDQTGYFVVVEKTGSRRVNRIDTATVAIQSYGATLLDAIKLNQDVKRAMEGLTARGDIGGCHLQTDYNFTNTAKKQFRYQAVYDITYYEQEAINV